MSQPENEGKEIQQSHSVEKYILVADVNRIKEYLFASVRLRHIVNASALLALVNETMTKKLVEEKYGGEMIFTAGGVTEALFTDQKKATDCAKKLEALYPQETGTATAAVHVETWKTGEDFVTAVLRATRNIRLKKDAVVSSEDNGKGDPGPSQVRLQPEFEPMPFFGGSPFFRICEQTGVAYATFWEKREPDGDEAEAVNPEAFSAASRKQHTWEPPKDLKVELQPYACTNELPAGRKVGLNSKRGDRLTVDVLLRHRLAHEFQEENLASDDFDYPFDFEKLVAKASPRNYLGLMDADGNGFGDLLTTLAEGKDGKKPDKQDYKALSELLSETTREAFIEAAAKVLKPLLQSQLNPKPIRIPLRVLVMGGDDVFVVGLPQQIIAIANEFCRQFQIIAERRKSQFPSEMDLLKQLPPLTMSAGVVIAHYNFPFLSFQRLANRLLKSAKRRAWGVKKKWHEWEEQKVQEQDEKKPQKPTGSVDFQIITASGTEDLKTIRKEAYTIENPHEGKAFFTGRPYLVGKDLDELQKLRRFIARMKAAEISRRQIKALNDILRRGVNVKQSHFNFLYWFGRLREAEQPELDQKKVIKDFLDSQTGWLSPWQRDNRPGGSGKLYTPLLDAVELFDIRDELADEEIKKKEGESS